MASFPLGLVYLSNIALDTCQTLLQRRTCDLTDGPSESYDLVMGLFLQTPVNISSRAVCIHWVHVAQGIRTVVWPELCF